MVRIGEEQEKQQEGLQQMNLMLETRLQTLESRQGAAENNYVSIDKKGESSSHFITEIMDKMESKLQNMEMAV
jgi:hypothetical protein